VLVVLSIRFFAWKFNEQGNEKLPRHGSRHSGDTDTPHGPSDPSCLILVMVRAFALCFLSGPSNDAVFRYRWEKHEHAHRNTRPTAQRPPPTILLAHASWKKQRQKTASALLFFCSQRWFGCSVLFQWTGINKTIAWPIGRFH
jgi:hypothetical protein